VKQGDRLEKHSEQIAALTRDGGVNKRARRRDLGNEVDRRDLLQGGRADGLQALKDGAFRANSRRKYGR
jgi:hypothetical protein